MPLPSHEECRVISPACGACRCETGARECGRSGQLLGDAHLVLLRQRGVLVGAEIPAIFGGGW